jgi:hypothetical protein
VPLSVFDVRRSERIKKNNAGFKTKSCLSKECFCCSTEAPTLSSNVIRNLGTEFCSISAQALTEDNLKKKSAPKKLDGPRAKSDKTKE